MTPLVFCIYPRLATARNRQVSRVRVSPPPHVGGGLGNAPRQTGDFQDRTSAQMAVQSADTALLRVAASGLDEDF